MLYSNLDSTPLSFLAQPNSKNNGGCVILNGGATPEIRHNYSGDHIVFNAIHACITCRVRHGHGMNDNLG